MRRRLLDSRFRGNDTSEREGKLSRVGGGSGALDMRVFYTLNATNGVGASADAIIAALSRALLDA